MLIDVLLKDAFQLQLAQLLHNLLRDLRRLLGFLCATRVNGRHLEHLGLNHLRWVSFSALLLRSLLHHQLLRLFVNLLNQLLNWRLNILVTGSVERWAHCSVRVLGHCVVYHVESIFQTFNSASTCSLLALWVEIVHIFINRFEAMLKHHILLKLLPLSFTLF